MPVVHKLPPTDELMEEYNIVKEKLLAEGKKRGAISFLAKKYNVHYTSVSKVIKSKPKNEKNISYCKNLEWQDNFAKEWDEIRNRLVTGKKIIIIKKKMIKCIPNNEVPKGFIY